MQAKNNWQTTLCSQIPRCFRIHTMSSMRRIASRPCWFVACLYKEVNSAFPYSDHTPIEFGWKMSADHERLAIDWVDGKQVPVPDSLEDIEADD